MHETYSKLPKAGLKNVLKQYKWLKGDGNEGQETMDSLRRLSWRRISWFTKREIFALCEIVGLMAQYN